jgi:hypothetical protein
MITPQLPISVIQIDRNHALLRIKQTLINQIFNTLEVEMSITALDNPDPQDHAVAHQTFAHKSNGRMYHDILSCTVVALTYEKFLYLVSSCYSKLVGI